MVETPKQAYDRGVLAGGIEQRLIQMDKHFATINGSQEETARELREIRLHLQRLADAFEAGIRTENAKAAALKTEREDKANELKDALSRSAQVWSPVTKAGLVLGLVLTLVGIVSFIINVIQRH